MGIGNMHWHLDGVDSFCKRGVVTVCPFEVVVASAGSFVSVTPSITHNRDGGG